MSSITIQNRKPFFHSKSQPESILRHYENLPELFQKDFLEQYKPNYFRRGGHWAKHPLTLQNAIAHAKKNLGCETDTALRKLGINIVEYSSSFSIEEEKKEEIETLKKPPIPFERLHEILKPISKADAETQTELFTDKHLPELPSRRISKADLIPKEDFFFNAIDKDADLECDLNPSEYLHSTLGESINGRSNELHYAIFNSDKETIQSILNSPVVNKIINDKNELKLAPIHMAIKYQNVDLLKKLIDCHANLNLRGGLQDDYPLHMAIKLNHIEMVLLLIQNGADTNNLDKDGNNVLQIAAQCTDQQIYSIFQSKLFVALEKNDASMMRLLLLEGENPNAENKHGLPIVLKAIRCGNKELMDLLLEHGAHLDQNKALIEAVRGNHSEILEYLLKRGIRPTHLSLLHSAIINRNTLIFYILLPFFKEKISQFNESLTSPLEYAVQSGQLKIVEELILHGAKQNNDSLLNIAIKKNDIRMLELLINHNFNVNETNPNKTSPLYTAYTQKCSASVMTLLLNAKATFNIKNSTELQLLDDAVYKNNTNEVITLLKLGLTNSPNIHLLLNKIIEKNHFILFQKFLNYGGYQIFSNASHEQIFQIIGKSLKQNKSNNFFIDQILEHLNEEQLKQCLISIDASDLGDLTKINGKKSIENAFVVNIINKIKKNMVQEFLLQSATPLNLPYELKLLIVNANEPDHSATSFQIKKLGFLAEFDRMKKRPFVPDEFFLRLNQEQMKRKIPIMKDTLISRL